MISRYDIKHWVENSENSWLNYNEQEDKLYSKESGGFVCSMDTFVSYMRKKYHCSFESIYNEHATLTDIFRCTECGTVIFGGDDERYDPNLKCPTCSDYKPFVEYWTKEDIEQDEKKQNTIKFYEEAMQRQIEFWKRQERRNGKYDWQIGKKQFNFKNKIVLFELECDDITKSYLKGLRLRITFSKDIERRDGWFSWTHGKHIDIPLSWSAFYIQCIYRHLGKCHKDMRSKWCIGKAAEDRSE